MSDSIKENVHKEDQGKPTFEQITANKKMESVMKMMTPKVMVIAQPTDSLLDFNSVSSMNYNAKVKLCFVLIPTLHIFWVLGYFGLSFCLQYEENIAMVNKTSNCSLTEEEFTVLSCSTIIDMIINVYVIVTILELIADVFAAIVETRSHIILWMFMTVGGVAMNIVVFVGYLFVAYHFGFAGNCVMFWVLAFLDVATLVIRLTFFLNVRVLFQKMKAKCQLKKSKGVMAVPIASNFGDVEYFLEVDMKSFK